MAHRYQPQGGITAAEINASGRTSLVDDLSSIFVDALRDPLVGQNYEQHQNYDANHNVEKSGLPLRLVVALIAKVAGQPESWRAITSAPA